jgi:hypothetical protein
MQLELSLNMSNEIWFDLIWIEFQLNLITFQLNSIQFNYWIKIQLNFELKKKWDANWWEKYWIFCFEYGVGKRKL